MGLEPESCVVVEDALNGAKAAKAINAACLGITTSFTSEELLDAGADWTAADMKEGCLKLFE
jgi:beta-phosphoglucomutase-like phosphatase (HAD superfamily)